MIKTTRAQREALFKVFRRSFPTWVTPTLRLNTPVMTTREFTVAEWTAMGKEDPPRHLVKVPSIQYRQFRRTVQGTFCMDNCIMVPFANMWLGIETDGYTHS